MGGGGGGGGGGEGGRGGGGGVGVMILFFFKGQVKSPVLHNTSDGTEFYVPTICNFRGRTSALVRVGRLHTCLL